VALLPAPENCSLESPSSTFTGHFLTSRLVELWAKGSRASHQSLFALVTVLLMSVMGSLDERFSGVFLSEVDLNSSLSFWNMV
jgi:hypothetical protein